MDLVDLVVGADRITRRVVLEYMIDVMDDDLREKVERFAAAVAD